MEGAATHSPLMLIHGAWLSSRSWDTFAEYFRDRGYRRLRPRMATQAGRRRRAARGDATQIEGLGLTEIVDHYEAADQGARRASRS